MNNNYNHIGVKSLKDIYGAINDKEFGFIAQALLAMIFFRLGANIERIKSSGHPDIILYYNLKKWKIEVEVIGTSRNNHTIKKDDLEAVKPISENWVGYLAFLDMHPPQKWYLIDIMKLLNNIGMFKKEEKARSYRLIELRINSEKDLNEACTAELFKITSQYKEDILRKKYSGLIEILKKQNDEILFE